jgi:hypothetical protein
MAGTCGVRQTRMATAAANVVSESGTNRGCDVRSNVVSDGVEGVKLSLDTRARERSDGLIV